MEEQEVGVIDQNLANNLDQIENFKPGSEEREALLAESKFYEQARQDEAKTEIEYRKQALAEAQFEYDQQKHDVDTKVKIAEIAVKGVIGLGSLIGAMIVAFGEMDLEENGANRSKAAQKFGSIFKGWK